MDYKVYECVFAYPMDIQGMEDLVKQIVQRISEIADEEVQLLDLGECKTPYKMRFKNDKLYYNNLRYYKLNLSLLPEMIIKIRNAVGSMKVEPIRFFIRHSISNRGAMVNKIIF